VKKIKKRLKKKLVIHEQWIEVLKQGEEQTSTFYPPNDEFTRMLEDMDPQPDLIYRRMNFICGVPKQYMWTEPSKNARLNGGHALHRMKAEEWPHVMEEERLNGNKFVVPAPEQQPRPEQFGPCPCARCTEEREAEYQRKHESRGSRD
jgi:hypothetical protein